MKTTADKSQIMSRAWQIARCIARQTGSAVKATSYIFSDAMRQAWREAKARIANAIKDHEIAEERVGVTNRQASERGEIPSLAFMSGCADIYKSSPRGTYFGD